MVNYIIENCDVNESCIGLKFLLSAFSALRINLSF